MVSTHLAECGSCGGSGLYQGFMERGDEAVVCVSCRGQGYRAALAGEGKQFTHRKRKNGVRKIRFGSGTILDNPGRSGWMTYDEFREKVPEKQ